MPIKHAALKQLRKDRKRQSRNQSIRSDLRTIVKRFSTLLKKGRVDEARLLLGQLASKFDRAAGKGILHRNTVSRSKSRLTKQLNRHGKTSR